MHHNIITLGLSDAHRLFGGESVSGSATNSFVVTTTGRAHSIPRIATRIFDTPLMIDSDKLDVILQVLGPRLGVEGTVPVAAGSYDRLDRKPYAVSDAGVAVIDISGTLVNRSTGMEAWSGMSSYEQINAELQDAVSDPAISAILLRADSPGGECSGSFDLADAIFAARGKKPIWASVYDMAFSAGYLLASAADQIFVTRTSGVGSVGVLAVHVDQSALDAKLGLKYTTMFAGKKKTERSPHAPLSEEAKSSIEAEINRLYGMFVDTVARHRSISADAVRATEAGLYYGEDAVAVGFADKIGTFSDALAQIEASAGGKRSSFSLAASAEAISPKEADMPKNETQADVDQKLNPNANQDADPKPVPASEPAPAAEAPAKPPVVDDEDEDKKEGEPVAGKKKCEDSSSAAADPMTVLELCAIAGLTAEDTKAVIAKGLTEAEVRKHLIGLRTAAEPAGIKSRLGPAGSSSVDGLLAAAADLAKQKPGMTKEQAFVHLLESTPGAYEQYLAANPRQTGEHYSQ